MDWKVLVSVFGAIFVAELGDKTQLAVITLTGTTSQPLSVFCGAAAALVTVSLLGVAAGAVLPQIVPLEIVRKLGAVAFIAVGVAMLFDWL